jgi:hypothetical protein
MFIPWGDWQALSRLLPSVRWQLLGCVSPEDRCLAAPLAVRSVLEGITLVKILDESPLDAAAEAARLKIQEEKFLREFLSPVIFEKPLLATLDDVLETVEKVGGNGDSVILDITSFPKRWFFGLLRFLLDGGRFANVVVTYTAAGSYANTLAFNPETVRALPGFSSMKSRDQCDVAFVGVGFQSHSIMDLFDLERPRYLSMFLPFPPGPPGLVRNWKFVERFETAIFSEQDDRTERPGIAQLRMGALDTPQCFAALVNGSDKGQRSSLVAPFGPKPMSLAMALFCLCVERAGLAEVPAYYSQPLRYALDYSVGVSRYRGTERVLCYPILMEGRPLYRL